MRRVMIKYPSKLFHGHQNIKCLRIALCNTEMAHPKPVENRIRQKLSSHFNATQIDVVNESHKHNVPKNSETHFKVLVVSEDFNNLPLLMRHRLVNNTLKDELKSGVHALSIIAKTPEQWKGSSYALDSSPNCQGGFGK